MPQGREASRYRLRAFLAVTSRPDLPLTEGNNSVCTLRVTNAAKIIYFTI